MVDKRQKYGVCARYALAPEAGWLVYVSYFLFLFAFRLHTEYSLRHCLRWAEPGHGIFNFSQ